MRFGYVFLGLVTLASLHISSGQCTNGLAGVQTGDVCCDPGCETCGGSGCGQQAGGSMNCCTGPIRDSGVMCSTAMEAPCIIDDETVCSNGLVGVERDGICCEAQCGTCGGRGCAGLPGGSSSCCGSTITASGDMCSTTMAAPCIIDDAEVCSNGLPGVERDGVCCEAQCGTCGGSGCAGRPGGPSSCCGGTITASGDMCSTTMAAPCIIDDAVVCSNGVRGVERDGVCCEAECGTCGGSGCARRPGGSAACCGSTITDSGDMCSMTMAAPCIIDDIA